MRNFLNQTGLLVLLAMPAVTHAAFFDFQAWIAVNGEQGFDNSTPFMLTDAGLTLTATAYEEPGMVDSHVYMDDVFNGIIGGMGVCSELTASMQCTPSSDDNVSIDGGSQEVLSWDFNLGLTSLTLELGDSEHFDFDNSDFEYSLDGGSSWLTGTTDGNAMVTLLAGGSDSIDFRTAGADKTDYFYLRNADITPVPLPAALWLFAAGMLTLVNVARRR